MRKIITNLFLLGIIFSFVGFKNAEAAEFPVVPVTYEIWDHNGPINEDSLVNEWILKGWHYDYWTDMTPEGQYSYLIVRLEDDKTTFNVSSFGYGNPYSGKGFSTLEEAKSAAMEAAKWEVSGFNSYGPDRFGYKYEYINRDEIPTATISYSTTNPTNQDVVATVHTSKPVTITNNEGSNQYTFKENGEFTFEFVDAAGIRHSVTAKVSNIDKVPPKLSVSLDPSVLSVPNNKMVTVQATLNYTDAESGIQYVRLNSITSNEPDSGLDNGDQPNDIQNAIFGTEDTSFDLRAERSGKGDGRIYTITYTVTDKAGNSTTRTATVTVLHDLGE
ncbi:hypothetical protein [Neobacillus cucumis]|uniref:hypothetical protein n=1 Tax=Neobacillus cucumis TaxID=1740721 RepID=UPI002E1C22D0|nr:hypothetical protein [Neobacillus cucumis]